MDERHALSNPSHMNRNNIDEVNMLNDKAALATLPVRNIDVARKFYESTVGLTPVSTEEPGVVGFRSGNSTVLVYESQYAGTNKATAASFQVPEDSFDDEVAALRNQGIEFLTFDYPGITWDDGVATTENERSVWFTDPDGNILAVGTI